MEGCPRSLMLSVDLKESFPTEFSPSLKSYIREHYHEDADSYKSECSQLEQLRTASLHPTHDHSGCNSLRRYYAQLQFLQSRFPMGEGGAVSVQFTWTDLYSEEPISLCDLRFEQASILHNLAALHSQLGCHEDRTAEEGMKVACTHFQAAAGIFQHLKDHFASDAFFDMAGCLLQLYTNVMLGQAQECLLEKSILDGRKNSLIARISMQVHDYYQQALQFLDSQGASYMGSRKAKIWSKNLKIKCCHYLCVSYIHMSNNADENQKFGEKVAYLKAASQKVAEAQKASKGQPERTLDLLQFVGDVVSNKLQGAVKDNDFIYHEAVPELDALPEIKAAPLVKPIPFQPSDSSGPDIFQRLIPMKAHTDASLYSEEKANLLRRYVGSIEQKNQLLSKALADLHIDDLLEPEEYDTLPVAIKKTSESLKKEGDALKDAENNIEELTKVGSKVEQILTSLSEMLKEDKRREKELEEQIGPITPPPERESFEKDLEECQESHKKASQTNNELMKVFKEHKHNLDLLAGPSEGLLAALPSLNIIDTPIDDGAVQRLRDLISKVDQMKSQRRQLEAEFRKQLGDDDITHQLVTREEGNKTVFFQEQLKKHDKICTLIQTNLDAQEKILRALTEANAKYAPTRQAVKETAHRRDDVVQLFVLSYETFLELKEKLSRGLRFYQSLEKTVTKLEEKLKDFLENHNNEMGKLKEKAKKTKEKTKVPPARPGEAKPDYLVHPPASSVPQHLANQYPGALPMSNLGIRPEGPSSLPPGVPLHTRLPGGVPPPGTFHGVPPPHSAGAGFYQPGSQGGMVGPSLPGAQAQIPIVSRAQPTFPEQRVPQSPSSLATAQPVFPPGQPPTGIPLSQVGPRVSIPAEQLIHSTPRMSYPVPVGTPLPPGSQPRIQPGPPRSPYQVLPGQQYVPQPPPGQKLAGPGGAQRLPSYDQAKILPGSQPMDPGQQGAHSPVQPSMPPQPNLPPGQQPAPLHQQGPGQHMKPQQPFGPQQFQNPRLPRPQLQPQPSNQPLPPQMYQQRLPLGQIPQPSQPPPRQPPPQNWQSQQFQIQKQPQQPGFPQQPLQPSKQSQQFQQPPLQPQHPYLQPSKPPQQFQQPPKTPQQMQPPFPPQQQIPQPTKPPQPLQQSLQHPQQFQQPPQALQQFQQPLKPQQQFQQPPRSQQQFQQPLQPKQQFQQLSNPPQQFQHPSQPQQQIQQPSKPQQQFQQPSHSQQPLHQPHKQFQQPLQPNQQLQPQQQFQQTLQPKGQQFPQSQQQPQQPAFPPKNYQQPLHPQQHPQFQQPLQPGQDTQRSLHPQQFPPYQPQQAGQTRPMPPQGVQMSEDTSRPQQLTQVGNVPQLPPKRQSSQPFTQMAGQNAWQQQPSEPPLKPPHPGLPPQQNQPQSRQPPYTGYSPSQQPAQPPVKSSQVGYPTQPENQPMSKPSLQGISQQPGQQIVGGFPPTGVPEYQHSTSLPSSASWQYPKGSQSVPSTGGMQQPSPYLRQDSIEKQQSFAGKLLQSGPKQPNQPMAQPFKQVQQPSQSHRASQGQPQQRQQSVSDQEQLAYPPSFSRQDSTDSKMKPAPYGQQSALPAGADKIPGKPSQYPGYSTSQIPASPPYSLYSRSASQPPTTLPSGSEAYRYSREPGRGASAPVLVQGVRPSPTSLPSSAYATSYTVSLAQAQLSQQQQMQQLQQQMLLQQQQLILQQQELLRHQQQQQQHDSDQGHLTHLFQQVLQQQKQLAEMEQKLKEKAEHGDHEEQHEAGHIAVIHDSPMPHTVLAEKDKEVNEKDQEKGPASPHGSSGFSASWSTGMSDHLHGKINMEQMFDNLAKKQISEISGKLKHDTQDEGSCKSTGNLENKSEDSSITKDAGHDLVKEPIKTKQGTGIEESSDVIHSEEKTEEKTEKETEARGVEDKKESESDGGAKQNVENVLEVGSTSSSAKPKSEKKTDEMAEEVQQYQEEEKEKKRLQEVEEQIQKIKELQKNPPPKPPKQQYLYEPGKMPELSSAPSEAPAAQPLAVEPNKPSLYRQCGHYYETQSSSIGQEENNKCLSEEEYIQKLSYTVEMFEALVVSLEQRREKSNYTGFISEWKELERGQEEDSAILSTHAATRNPSRNRYRDILPWDHSRVTLDTKESGDYINANLIKNITPLSPNYICTQGPVAATLGDFWLMVWEQKSRVIVMLTKEVEGNRLKCHQYWPIDEGHTVVYEPMRVTLKRLTHFPAWIERIMHVQHAESQETLVVSHLQFVGWPDYGVPHSPSDLLSFMAEVHNHHQQGGSHPGRPLIVHCSAGVGRAGTFCVIYTAIRELNGTACIVNILKLVRKFRRQRKFMVQKKEQYEFCYRTILFYANQFIQLEKAAIALKNAKAASQCRSCEVDDTSGLSSSYSSDHRKSEDVSFLGEIFDDEDSESESEGDLDADLDRAMAEDGCRESDKSGVDEGIRDAECTDTDKQCAKSEGLSETDKNSEVKVRDSEGARECSSSEKDVAVNEEEERIKDQNLQAELSSIEVSEFVEGSATSEAENDLQDKQVESHSNDAENAKVEEAKTDDVSGEDGEEAVQTEERGAKGSCTGNEEGEANKANSREVPPFELPVSGSEGVCQGVSSKDIPDSSLRQLEKQEQQENKLEPEGQDNEEGDEGIESEDEEVDEQQEKQPRIEGENKESAKSQPQHVEETSKELQEQEKRIEVEELNKQQQHEKLPRKKEEQELEGSQPQPTEESSKQQQENQPEFEELNTHQQQQHENRLELNEGESKLLANSLDESHQQTN